MESYWPLSAFIDYITTVPFGPCAPGDLVRLMSGGYGHYDNEYVYRFKRIKPVPQIAFEERHPGAFQPEKYFLDFLSPAHPLPTLDPWPFDEDPESAVYVQPDILRKKAPVLMAKREEGSWEFLSNEKTSELTRVRFGDVASLDKSLARLGKLLPGSSARRASSSAEWKTT